MKYPFVGLAKEQEYVVNPYEDLDERSFWRPAVSQRNPFDIVDLYTPKFSFGPDDKIATAGSCFAQHIAKRLARAGFQYRDYEPAPPGFPPAMMAKFNYGVYSARYCNLYTVRQLLQLFKRAFGQFVPQDQFWVAEDGMRDTFRPLVEPEAYADMDDAMAARDAHFANVRKLFLETDIFVFTLGLTEAWEDTRDGAILPVCPGTQAGTFDPAIHRFVNFRTDEMHADFKEFMTLVSEVNPSLRFLLTVSPVPLVATASGHHVLTSTVHSKSALRAVAGEIANAHDNVAYFPSFEIISAAPYKGMFFEPNMRGVNESGVDLVMKHFFKAHPPEATAKATTAPETAQKSDVDLVCEEMLLEMYAK